MDPGTDSGAVVCFRGKAGQPQEIAPPPFAGAECLQLDAVTGEKTATLIGVAVGTDWGYIGPHDGMSIGMSQGTTAVSSSSRRFPWIFLSSVGFVPRQLITRDVTARLAG